jgi:hypothetical protein
MKLGTDLYALEMGFFQHFRSQPAFAMLSTRFHDALTGFHLTGPLLEIAKPTAHPTLRELPPRTDLLVSGNFAGRIL